MSKCECQAKAEQSRTPVADALRSLADEVIRLQEKVERLENREADYQAAWGHIKKRLMVGQSVKYQWAQDGTLAMNVSHLCRDLEAMGEEVRRLREALEWYAKRAAGCSLTHSGGDADRDALSADAGQRAREALAYIHI